MDRTNDLRAIQDALTLIARVQYSRRARRRIEDRSGVPLAPIAIETLSAINVGGPARHGAIARRVGTQASRISKEVQALVAAGFVQESRDPHDRRAVLLEATEKGSEALRRYVDAAGSTLADVLSGWSDADLAQFAPLIRRLAECFAVEPFTPATAALDRPPSQIN